MSLPAARRQSCLVAVMLCLAVVLSACTSRVVLKSIPAEVIPEEVRRFVPDKGHKGGPISGVVWRVYEIKDGQLFVAFTYAEEWPPYVMTDMFLVLTANIDEAGRMTGPWRLGGGPFDTYVAFNGAYGRSEPEENRVQTYSLFASGYCLDGRVKAIQGTTTDGRTVKSKPSAGFWHLELDNTGPTEDWAKISGIDWTGKPVVDLEIRPRPWEDS